MFISALQVEKIGKKKWKLLIPLIYTGSKEVIVPSGFETDFASVPQIAWWFCAPTAGKHAKPSVLHDYLCETSNNQKKTDKLFLEAMEINGVSWFKRTVMFQLVRGYQVLKGKYFKKKIKGKAYE